MEQLKD